MKKKVLIWFLTALSVLQLTGCGSWTQADRLRYQDDYYEYINKEVLDEVELAATDAHWDWFGELNAIANEEMEDRKAGEMRKTG